MRHFLKVYKGLNDYHVPIFASALNATKASKVLYPGCDKHLQASLFFKDVCYIDFNSKMEIFYKDENILEWVKANKRYPSNPKIKFKAVDFEKDFGEKPETFDLMISASAGIVSRPCGKYVKKGGWFLVSDAHYDARQAFVDEEFKLVAVYENASEKFEFSPESLKGHFTTKDGEKLSQKHVDESKQKPKAKRSFKLEKEGMFYLFQKI